MSTAAEACRTDHRLRIVAFDRGGVASSSQCGLPYLIGGLVPDTSHLIARTVEQFSRQDTDVRLDNEIVAIDPARQVVQVRDVAGGAERAEPYDRLMIATSASPVRLSIPGLDLDGVFTLDVLEDALALQAYLTRRHPQKAVVIGAGYIALEMVENQARLALEVHVIQRGDQVFPTIDSDMPACCHRNSNDTVWT